MGKYPSITMNLCPGHIVKWEKQGGGNVRIYLNLSKYSMLYRNKMIKKKIITLKKWLPLLRGREYTREDRDES